jgi:Protein of unknown function (DUF2924)
MRNQSVRRTDSKCPDPRALYPDPDGSVLRQIQELEAMTVKELQRKHLELFGTSTRSKHKQQLFKRLAWRVQELKWGGLSDDLLQRLREIEDDRDARFLPPRKPSERMEVVEVPRRPQKSVPVPGTVVEREYEGELHRVTILDKGVSYRGKQYRSLSGVANAITGTNWSGPRFFGLKNTNGGAR